MLRRFSVASLLLLLLLLPAALTAQQGTITYTFSAKYDFELPEGMPERFKDRLPTSRSGTMLLHFDPSASLMTPAPGEEKEETDMMRLVGGRGFGRVLRMMMGSSSRSDQENIRESYVRYDDGTIVETRDFMGRTFRIADRRPSYEWRLTSEQAEHLGYMVIKATAQHDSTDIEAWFTPQIPVQGGPASFGGLPGMILVVSLDGGNTKYFATEIALEGLEEGLIRIPEDGDEVSRERYDEIIAEKLKELEQLNRRRGRDRRPGGDK